MAARTIVTALAVPAIKAGTVMLTVMRRVRRVVEPTIVAIIVT